MTTNILTARPETTMTEAKQMMQENDIHCLPILDDDELVGMLTSTDLQKMDSQPITQYHSVN